MVQSSGLPWVVATGEPTREPLVGPSYFGPDSTNGSASWICRRKRPPGLHDESWHQVPLGRPFIARFVGRPPDACPDEFEAAAARCPVFRLEPETVVAD